MKEIVQLPVSSAKKNRPCDCGLCCVMIKADSPNFQKEANTVCNQLIVINGQARCSDYENRDVVCRKYVCERPGAYPQLKAQLEQHIANALSGPEKFPQSKKLVSELDRMGLLRHSNTVTSLKESRVPALGMLTALKKVADPFLEGHDRDMLRMTGVSQFMQRVSPDGARRFMIWMQSIIYEDISRFQGYDEWHRVRPIILYGLAVNPQFGEGFSAYQEGNMELPGADLYAFRKAGIVPAERPQKFSYQVGINHRLVLRGA